MTLYLRGTCDAFIQLNSKWSDFYYFCLQFFQMTGMWCGKWLIRSGLIIHHSDSRSGRIYRVAHNFSEVSNRVCNFFSTLLWNKVVCCDLLRERIYRTYGISWHGGWRHWNHFSLSDDCTKTNHESYPPLSRNVQKCFVFCNRIDEWRRPVASAMTTTKIVPFVYFDSLLER